MQLYLCLLFDNASHVRSIEKVEADDNVAAKAEAQRLMQALPQIVGYELWKDGRKVASFFEPPVQK